MVALTVGTFVSSGIAAQSTDDQLIKIAQAVHEDVGGYGADGHDDEVAVELRSCLRLPERGGNVGGYSCYEDAYNRYDAVLNAVYKRALAANSGALGEAIKITQRKWLAFRDAEDASAQDYRHSRGGTVYGQAIMDKRVSSIRQRIGELVLYTGYDER